MEIYIYLYLWAGIGCLIGVILGFTTAALMASASHRDTVDMLKNSNSNLANVAEELASENAELNNRLDAIKATVTKYFPKR